MAKKLRYDYYFTDNAENFKDSDEKLADFLKQAKRKRKREMNNKENQKRIKKGLEPLPIEKDIVEELSDSKKEKVEFTVDNTNWLRGQGVNKNLPDSERKWTANKKFAESLGNRRFEEAHKLSLADNEIIKEVDSGARSLMERKMEFSTYLNDKKEDSFPENSQTKKYLSVREKLRNYSIEEWVYLVAGLHKLVPSLVTALDLDIKRIAFNGEKYSQKGYSTLMQVNSIFELEEQKAQLLNIYCLNYKFAELVEDDKFQKEVFLCVIQKSKSPKSIPSSKLRTAYRTRRHLVQKFRNYCVSHGFDAKWFYDHFSTLPSVRYYAETVEVEKKIKEIDVDKA